MLQRRERDRERQRQRESFFCLTKVRPGEVKWVPEPIVLDELPSAVQQNSGTRKNEIEWWNRFQAFAYLSLRQPALSEFLFLDLRSKCDGCECLQGLAGDHRLFGRALKGVASHPSKVLRQPVACFQSAWVQPPSWAVSCKDLLSEIPPGYRSGRHVPCVSLLRFPARSLNATCTAARSVPSGVSFCIVLCNTSLPARLVQITCTSSVSSMSSMETFTTTYPCDVPCLSPPNRHCGQYICQAFLDNLDSLYITLRRTSDRSGAMCPDGAALPRDSPW